MTVAANAELEQLRVRNKQLAEDKAYLQLIIRLVERINPTVGIEQMVTALLASIVETIGGTNIRLWYWLGEKLCYLDFLGASQTVDAIDDPLAQQALEQGRLIEEAVNPAAALLRGGMIPGAWHWGFPLLAGPKQVGVIKLENLNIDSARLRDYLPIFFSHVALILSNEIHNVLRQQAEEKQRLAANVFTHAREGIMITDADVNVIEVNDAFTRITGYAHEQVLGKNPRLLKSGRHPPEFYVALWQALINSGHWSGEIWNRRQNGELFAEMLTISAVRDAAGKTQHYVALFTDITSSKEHQRQLEHIAYYDALTGLPNRMLLADRLQQAMAQSRRQDRALAVVYLDLDGFKTVNDMYGHHMGDELLVTLAQRMKATLREGDTLARIGGDEFVAVLVDLNDNQDCVLALERLLRAAADPVMVQGKALSVSASIGVTHYPEDAVDADQLMRHADQAMYQAKQAGKNRWQVFRPLAR